MRITSLKIIITVLAVSAVLWLLFGFFGIQALFTNTTVNDPLPVATIEPDLDTITSSTPTTIPPTTLSGDFTQGDSTYSIKGTANIITENGTRTLVLSDFDVTNGPDLFVYFVSASSTENTTVKQRTGEGHFIQLAELKGNRGNQTYTLPSDLDLAEYPIVSIWCRRFSRNFGAAQLGAE